jgi:lipopolysaccharide biosynthesis glycosyltransferase
MKSLDIIVRTHDKSNVSKFPRFISVSKRELIEGCMTSLINAINQCKNSIKIIVLDDHSSQEFLNNLQDILKTLKHFTKVISFQEDSYIDWKYWWETYTHKSKSFELNYK